MGKTLGFQCKVGGSLARELRSPMSQKEKKSRIVHSQTTVAHDDSGYLFSKMILGGF